MKLILGLGNPDAKYSLTRHNFGFRAVDFFAKKLTPEISRGLTFSEFRFEKKFRAEISEQKIGNEKVFLVKPQTFMNLSGESARALLDFYKPPLMNFLVVYDDVDLPFGKIRIREGGGSGGHRGIKNLIAHFGTKNFARLRLGIASELLGVMPTEEFVLQKFSKDEEEALPKILEKAAGAAGDFLANGLELAMNRYN